MLPFITSFKSVQVSNLLAQLVSNCLNVDLANMQLCQIISNLNSSAFSLFGIGASSYRSPRSPISCFFCLYVFLLHVLLYNIAPSQFLVSRLSVSTHFHVLITTSSSVFFSTCPIYLSLTSLIFFLTFTTPALVPISSVLIFSILFISIIHLNILISSF